MRVTRASPRIGAVKYLNALPLVDGWPGQIRFDHPSVISGELARGALDVALVSSFEYLRNPIYTVVDGVAIGSRGAVYSVILACRGELSELKEVELDPASQTSVNLLRCLLREANLEPELIPTAENTRDAAPGPERGKLLIGDQAMQFREQHATGCKFYDLGEEWERATSLPFIYALWLIRPEVKSARSIAAQLRALCDQNLERLPAIAQSQTRIAPDLCHRYLSDYLRYSFGEAEKNGLQKFRSLCQAQGILGPTEPDLRLA